MKITLTVYNIGEGTSTAFTHEGAPPDEIQKRVLQFGNIFFGASFGDWLKVALPKAVNAFDKSNYGFHTSESVNADIYRFRITVSEGSV